MAAKHTRDGWSPVLNEPGNPFGPPRPVRCFRCRHVLAECPCNDEKLTKRGTDHE